MCGLDVLVLDELGNEAAQKGLSRRRVATEMPISDCSSGHDGVFFSDSVSNSTEAQGRNWCVSQRLFEKPFCQSREKGSHKQCRMLLGWIG